MKKHFKSHVHCTEYTAYNVSTSTTKLNSNASTITYSYMYKKFNVPAYLISTSKQM